MQLEVMKYSMIVPTSMVLVLLSMEIFLWKILNSPLAERSYQYKSSPAFHFPLHRSREIVIYGRRLGKPYLKVDMLNKSRSYVQLGIYRAATVEMAVSGHIRDLPRRLCIGTTMTKSLSEDVITCSS